MLANQLNYGDTIGVVGVSNSLEKSNTYDNFYTIFKRIIRECHFENTYKMAWAKALVEVSLENTSDEKNICIELRTIAKKYIKYYWNQTIFFDLVQGSNLIKTPTILQEVKKLIEEYYKEIGERKPIRFEEIEHFLEEKLTKSNNQCLENVIKTLKKDVSWRFTFIDGKNQEEIYCYCKGSNEIYMRKEHIEILKENAEDLFDLINYRWGIILETFNSCPKINKKVKIIDEQEVRRNSLTKFKKYLDKENKDKTCFICEKEIEAEELSIDHVIPWSYLYSDDLWNLVYVHRSCNSSKSNVIPRKEDVERLKLRNKKLLEILKKEKIEGKDVDELELAIEKELVNKFWIGCKS